MNKSTILFSVLLSFNALAATALLNSSEPRCISLLGAFGTDDQKQLEAAFDHPGPVVLKLTSGLQIMGKLSTVISPTIFSQGRKTIAYFQMEGPVKLLQTQWESTLRVGKTLNGFTKNSGLGSPIGLVKSLNGQDHIKDGTGFKLSSLSDKQTLDSWVGNVLRIEYMSGIKVAGILESYRLIPAPTAGEFRLGILTFKEGTCTVTHQHESSPKPKSQPDILFGPDSPGSYILAVGEDWLLQSVQGSP